MSKNIRKAFEAIGSLTGSIADNIISYNKSVQENKKSMIRITENQKTYNLVAIELSEAALACATAICVAQPTPQNVKKAYDGTTSDKVYRLVSNSIDNPPIENISATLNHVLEERRNRRLVTPNIRQLYVEVNYAPQGYDVRLVGINLTKGCVLPNITYGKKIGILVHYCDRFYINYPDNTSVALPLGAKFTYLDFYGNWVDDYILYDMEYDQFRLGRSGAQLQNYFVKL